MDKNPKCPNCKAVTTIEKKEETIMIFRCQNCLTSWIYKKKNGKWIADGG